LRLQALWISPGPHKAIYNSYHFLIEPIVITGHRIWLSFYVLWRVMFAWSGFFCAAFLYCVCFLLEVIKPMDIFRTIFNILFFRISKQELISLKGTHLAAGLVGTWLSGCGKF
jgi:hypothetical protein